MGGMNPQGKGWIVAASMGVVEALKDQGVCRWTHTFRSIHRQAKGSLGSITMAQKLPAAIDRRSEMSEKAKKAEESLRTVMYLSSWGPN